MTANVTVGPFWRPQSQCLVVPGSHCPLSSELLATEKGKPRNQEEHAQSYDEGNQW